MKPLPRPPRQCQHGISLVELMVAMAIGLAVIAWALTAWTQHMKASRHLLLQARLTQDMQTVADALARDLRRAGHWRQAGLGVWHAESPSPTVNPHTALEASGGLHLSYSDPDEIDEDDASPAYQLGYRLRNGAIEMQLGRGAWQTLTDATAMVVSRFELVPQTQSLGIEGFCQQLQVRSVGLHIEAHAASDPALVHRMQTQVRVRNDVVTPSCSP